MRTRTRTIYGGAFRVTEPCGVCYGTKECDECSCGGDPAKCDFYPEKREKCTFDDRKGDKSMNTAEMWLAAQNNGKKYKCQDMRYKKTTGFCDSSGMNWNPDAFRSIEDIMQRAWTECKEMTRTEAEKALGVDIID